MKKTFLAFLMMLLTLGLGLTSCSETDNPINVDDIVYDVVTIASTSSDGTTFTFRKLGDSPLITLTTNQAITGQNAQVGQRVLIGYVPDSGNRYESGSITLVAIAVAYGSEIKTGTSEPTSGWKSDPYTMVQLWRSGEFINVQLMAAFSSEPSAFDLYLDTTTADSEYPEFHVVFLRDFTSDVNRDVFGSYDISPVWNLGSCKGVKVFYNSNSGVQSSLITKNTSVEITPTGQPVQ